MSSTTRRAVTVAACAAVLLAALSGSASASAFDTARLRREHLAHRIARLRTQAREQERALRVRIAGIERVLGAAPPRKLDVSAGQWRGQRRHLLKVRKQARHRMHVLRRRQSRQVAQLGRLRGQVLAWIGHYGIFHACPVRGPHIVNNDYGVIVRRPDVPVHVHRGNDITAAMWTPVVAPFSGIAVAAPNILGGLAVKVYGEGGYVYNAHFVAYGQLGAVHTGSLIGYVGATGDAGGPHLHFEWHPGGGGAVDPNTYLNAVC